MREVRVTPLASVLSAAGSIQASLYTQALRQYHRVLAFKQHVSPPVSTILSLGYHHASQIRSRGGPKTHRFAPRIAASPVPA
jgi:hypothetical protein